MKPVFGWLNKRNPPDPVRPRPWMVNLGCGGCFHPDWINLDFVASSPEVIQHDLRTRLPFEDGSCEMVYHSHVMEHFPRAFAPLFLRECHRILTPGGLMRVVVPDLETIVRLYLKNLDGATSGDIQAAHRHEWLTLELLDQMVRERSGGEILNYWRQDPMPAEEFVIGRMGREVLRAIEYLRSHPEETADPASQHRPPKAIDVGKFRESGEVHKWMYDRWSLKVLLGSMSFTDTRVCAADESQFPGFARYCLDLNDDGSVRKPDSLFMEARKA
ncbi:MAG: methyltransferase domain-containing protein [Opitutaceae bacterium]|nr:methyltransferase domain-containing protein [Verrucomicrobiales bacterium]